MKKFKILFIVNFLFFALGCDSIEGEKPNIMFIMSDDHAYQAISAYDNRLINTPNIDRIANEGMLFLKLDIRFDLSLFCGGFLAPQAWNEEGAGLRRVRFLKNGVPM